MSSTNVAYLQYQVAFGDWNKNAETIEECLRSAPPIGLLVLPELAFSGYDFKDRAEAMSFSEDPKQGQTAAFLKSLARANKMHIVAGYVERGNGAPYNSAMLIAPNGDAHSYRKIHLFNREQDIFLPGDAPAPVLETEIGRIGIMICFDWFFPECARSLALRGADIIAHPANLVLPWCQRAMFARSVENRVYTVTANRIGTETRAGRELTFTGGSQILSPTGETLSQAPADAAHLGVANIDPLLARDKSAAGLNDLFKDRKAELYPGIF